MPCFGTVVVAVVIIVAVPCFGTVVVAVVIIMTVPCFGTVFMTVVITVAVGGCLRVYVDEFSGKRFALPEQPYGKHITRVEVVRIAEGDEFNGVAEHRLPVVRSGFAYLEDGFHVFGVPLVRVLIQRTVFLSGLQHIHNTVVLQVGVEGFGIHLEISCFSRYPSYPRTGLAGGETQDGGVVLFAPLRRVYLGSFAVADQAPVNHPGPGNGVFAFIEGAVEELNVGVSVWLQEETVQFQVHVMTTE